MDLDYLDQIIVKNGEVSVFGDVHIATSSDLTEHAEITKTTGGATIQIGDFSMHEKNHEWWCEHICKGIHGVLGGNHDHYPSIQKGGHSLGDFGVLKESGIMFIRGAQTPSFHFHREKRIEGKNWWKEEELTEEQMRTAMEIYVTRKPSIMITHDVIHAVRGKIHGIRESSRTSDFLQTLFEIHKPNTWLYGHHHASSSQNIDGCKFICIGTKEKYLLTV